MYLCVCVAKWVQELFIAATFFAIMCYSCAFGCLAHTDEKLPSLDVSPVSFSEMMMGLCGNRSFVLFYSLRDAPSSEKQRCFGETYFWTFETCWFGLGIGVRGEWGWAAGLGIFLICLDFPMFWKFDFWSFGCSWWLPLSLHELPPTQNTHGEVRVVQKEKTENLEGIREEFRAMLGF